MKLYSEVYLSTWMQDETWSGGRDTVNELTPQELDAVADALEEIFEGHASDTDINDFLWFERDEVATFAGFEDWEDLTARHAWEDGFDVSEFTKYPSTYSDVLQELREAIETDAENDNPRAVALMFSRGEDVDEITLRDLEEYFDGVTFYYDDFMCH